MLEAREGVTNVGASFSLVRDQQNNNPDKDRMKIIYDSRWDVVPATKGFGRKIKMPLRLTHKTGAATAEAYHYAALAE